jgi:N-methylhydantoinase B
MGGLGAGDDNDGLHTAAFPFTVTDSPVEVFENACPVIVAKRELVPDSGGAGQYRGGLGQEISLCPAPPDLGQVEGALTLAYSAGHLRMGAEGLDGGHAGGTGNIAINDKPVTGNLATIKIGEQDRVTFKLPGGGGYHSPVKRAPEAVQRDVIDGYVTLEAAKSIYGVVIDPATHALDVAATAALRKSMK